MSKTKMRCITCGKWFQSANAKEVTCPECAQKARKEKMAAKASPPANKTAGQTPPGRGSGAPMRSVPPPPKPASSGTSHWLDSQSDVKVGQPDQPPHPKLPSSPVPRENRGGGGRDRDGGYRSPGPGGYREGGNRESGNYREGGYRGPGGYREAEHRSVGPYRVGGGMGLPDTTEQRPRQPMTGTTNRGSRPGIPGEPRPERLRSGGRPGGQKTKTPRPKAETPPKPKREKIPPPGPFVPTAEQIAQVEARYMELAVPAEYDGIRTQISKELGLPKSAVKKIVKDLRDRQQLPSWWEIQTYKGDSEELEKIKALYVPFLPLPAVGVHKQIAEQLSLKPVLVYQAIKTIRQEMNLPQFNDPTLHGLELTPKAEKKTEAVESQAEEQKAETSANEEKPETAEAQVQEQKSEVQTEEKKQEPEGEISSIETDTAFHKVGDTTETVTAAATDTDTSSEV